MGVLTVVIIFFTGLYINYSIINAGSEWKVNCNNYSVTILEFSALFKNNNKCVYKILYVFKT